MDIEIWNATSFYMLQPVTDAGQLWVSRNISDALRLGDSVPIEPRYIEDIALGIMQAGLSLSVDGHPSKLVEIDGELEMVRA
jgi:hypothetical protein